MPGNFMDAMHRDFKPISIPALSQEARDGVNAALEAMAAWRNEIAKTNGNNGKLVIEKMATAAAALGWPEQVVDAARTQLKSNAEMQIKIMDQLLDAWEEQIKLPNPMTASPSAMLSKLQTLPGLAPTSNGEPTTPLQLWMQLAEQWQRAWAKTMGLSSERH